MKKIIIKDNTAKERKKTTKNKKIVIRLNSQDPISMGKKRPLEFLRRSLIEPMDKYSMLSRL